MHVRNKRPSVASGVAKRAAMAGGVSSVDGHGDGGGIFLVLTLPYLTLPYLIARKVKRKTGRGQPESFKRHQSAYREAHNTSGSKRS